MTASSGAILTLEPLIEAMRAGVEACGWLLSGMQKTTSHQFEGRWEGESTRSAYLFFHRPDGPDFASVDVYLDETGRGLSGNLALVVDLVPMARLGSVEAVLDALATTSSRELDDRLRRPVTLRLRLEDAADPRGEAEPEIRFKVRIPRRSIVAGAGAVSTLATDTVRAFDRLLGADEVRALAVHDDPEPDLG